MAGQGGILLMADTSKVIVPEKDIWAGKDVEPTEVVQAVDQAEDDGGMANADVGARLEELTSGQKKLASDQERLMREIGEIKRLLVAQAGVMK